MVVVEIEMEEIMEQLEEIHKMSFEMMRKAESIFYSSRAPKVKRISNSEEDQTADPENQTADSEN